MGSPVVTISAPYGAGGPSIGQVVADRLGVPFVDRAIPSSVARALAVPLSEAVVHDERIEKRIGRLLEALAVSGTEYGPIAGPGRILTSEVFREQTERVIRSAAETTGGCVILGRAAVIVLRDHPTALHVSLTGPLDRRVRQAAAWGTEDEAGVRRLVEDTDRTRTAYFRHFYRVDPDDARLYHLVIDSTVFDRDTCIELIVTAARSRSHRAVSD